MGRPHAPIADRFWNKVAFTQAGCWEWLGDKSHGYGVFTIKRNRMRRRHGAHRIAYIHIYGLIPNHLELDHTCRNPCCVNPNHLEAVTAQVNNHRGIGPCAQKVKQTHCHNGHEFSEANTYRRNNRKRECRICRKKDMENFYIRQRLQKLLCRD